MLFRVAILVAAVVNVVVGQEVNESYTGWQKYIVGPQQPVALPKAIVSTSGDVQNAEALVGSEGDAVLTRDSATDPAPAVILDFGVNIVGFVSIDFSGASSNTPGIRLAFSETLQYLTDTSDFSRSNNMAAPITPGSDQIAVAAEPYTWTDTWGCRNGTQICSDGLHGFRYLKIYLDALDSDAPLAQKTGTVKIASVSLQYSAFLGTPDTYQGWFECSDEELNQFWYSAVYTNDLTTDFFRETDVDPRGAYTPGLDGKLVLFDGAKRDRDPYVGDVAVSGRTGYLSHGNITSVAAKNLLADLADHQKDDGYIPSASLLSYNLLLFDYPLWWIIAVNDYYLHTEDTEFLTQYFPNMERALNDFYPAHTNNTSRLLSRPSGYGDYAFIGRDGEASYYNVLYVWALKAGADCAQWLGRNQTSDDWLQRASTVSEAINAVFWDENVGAYLNSVNTPRSHPQDANAIAVLAGVANRTRSLSALNYLSEKTSLPYGNAFMDDDSVVGGGSKRVYAFISYFDLKARMEMGLTASAIDEVKRLYGWMQKTDPASTYWEGIGSDGSMYEGGFTSAAHGWSTGVVSILTEYVLGLRLIGPGGDDDDDWILDIRPSETITWARGTYPTTIGPLLAQWWLTKEAKGNRLDVKVDIPEGTTGRIRLPRDLEIVEITHNGRAQKDSEGHLLVSGLSGSRHVLTVTYNAKTQ